MRAIAVSGALWCDGGFIGIERRVIVPLYSAVRTMAMRIAAILPCLGEGQS
jgi:hypothetical protein